MKSIGSLLTISFNVTVIAVITCTILFMSMAFVFLPGFRGEIQYISSLIGGGAAIYAAYYAGAALRERIQQDRKVNSFEFLKMMNDIGLNKLRAKLENEFDHRNTPQNEFYDRITKDPELNTVIRTILNAFERVSIAIQHDFVDEEIVWKSMAVIVCSMYKEFLPHISEVRARRKDNTIYCELELLANSWASGKYLSSGRKIIKALQD